MADVVVRLRLRPRPGRGVARDARRRARSSTTRRSTTRRPSAAAATASSSSSRSSRRTRAGWRRPPTRSSTSPAASARWARSRSRCARSPPRASTAWRRCGTAGPSTRPPAQLIVRESGGLVAFTGAATSRSARRWTSSRTRPSSPPARAEALAELATPARLRPRGTLRDRLDARRARRRRRRRLGERRDREAAARRPRRDGAPTRARASSPTPRLEPATSCRRPRRSTAATWASANLRTMRGTLDPLARAGRRAATARSPGRCSAAGGMLLAGEIGGHRRLHGPPRARPVRARAARPDAAAAAAAGRRPNLRRGRGASWRSTLDELLPWVVFHEVTHAGAVHRRAVAARAPRRDAARAARVGRGQGRPARAAAAAERRRPARAVGRRCARAGWSARSPAPSARR